MNPFNLTKSADMTDDLIHQLWVSVDKFDLDSKLKSLNSVFLLGGKGSGKTHLLRHYSYQLQKIRCEKNGSPKLQGVLEQDRYIGIYYRCKGLQADRFSGKGYSDEFWSEYFAYAFELTLGHELVYLLHDLVDCADLDQKLSQKIGEILNVNVSSLHELENKLAGIRRGLYVAVSNAALGNDLSKDPDAKILVSRGDLIFGIPKIVASSDERFKGIPFVYLIDEIENFNLEHQIYVNTLIREKEPEIAFKVGARRYGIKSLLTLSGGEQLIEGSEKDTLILDDKYREDKNLNNYSDFLLRLMESRINQYVENFMFSDNGQDLRSLYANSDISWKSEYVKDVVDRSLKKDRPHLKEFQRKISKLAKSEEIVELLRCEQYPVLEKVNIFNFYRSDISGDPVAIAASIKEDCNKFIMSDGKNKNSETYRRLDHYKNNMVFQLKASYQDKTFYCGLDNIIKMSEGMPRNFLQILKMIYDWGYQLEKNVFCDNGVKKFDLEVQSKAIKSASEWFYDDVRECEDRAKLKASMGRLGQLLRVNNYSDLPKECSCISFAVDIKKITPEAKKMLKMAEDYSFIIRSDSSKDKNHKSSTLNKYQINRMLCPLWDLPISSRGTKQLTNTEANLIWDASQDSLVEFEELRNKWEKEMSFSPPESKFNQQSLL